MDYFKENPTALMDAIPTPPGEEEDASALKDFRTGLTPKRKFNFKFNNEKSRGRTGSMDSLNNSFSAFAQNRPTTGLSQKSQRSNSVSRPFNRQDSRLSFRSNGNESRLSCSARSSNSVRNHHDHRYDVKRRNYKNSYDNRRDNLNRSSSRVSVNSQMSSSKKQGIGIGNRYGQPYVA